MIDEVSINSFWTKDTFESKLQLLHTIGTEQKTDVKLVNVSNFRNQDNFTHKATIASTMPMKNKPPLKLDMKMKMEPINVHVYKPPQTAVTCQNARRGSAFADHIYSNLAASTRISSREANSSFRPNFKNTAVSLHSKAIKTNL